MYSAEDGIDDDIIDGDNDENGRVDTSSDSNAPCLDGLLGDTKQPPIIDLPLANWNVLFAATLLMEFIANIINTIICWLRLRLFLW